MPLTDEQKDTIAYLLYDSSGGWLEGYFGDYALNHADEFNDDELGDLGARWEELLEDSVAWLDKYDLLR